MNILVLCTGNSCRSQIAEGFLRHYLDDSFNVYSAGIEKHGLNPKAVEIMAEIGIDISHHESNTIEELEGREYDYVVTVCDNAKENCPYFPAVREFIHQGFTDPSKFEGNDEEVNESYHVCREAIGLFCLDLSKRLTKIRN